MLTGEAELGNRRDFQIGGKTGVNIWANISRNWGIFISPPATFGLSRPLLPRIASWKPTHAPRQSRTARPTMQDYGTSGMSQGSGKCPDNALFLTGVGFHG